MTVIELVANLFREMVAGRGQHEVIFVDSDDGRIVIERLRIYDAADNANVNEVELTGG